MNNNASTGGPNSSNKKAAASKKVNVVHSTEIVVASHQEVNKRREQRRKAVCYGNLTVDTRDTDVPPPTEMPKKQKPKSAYRQSPLSRKGTRTPISPLAMKNIGGNLSCSIIENPNNPQQLLISSTMQTLNYPERLNPRPLTANDINSRSNLSNLEIKLKGLPGNLSLSESTMNKYFGDKGRDNFFGRYQFINKHNLLMNSQDKDDLTELFFDNEASEVEHPTTPFCPNRCNNNFEKKKKESGSSFRSRFKSTEENSSAMMNEDCRRLAENAVRCGDLALAQNLKSSIIHRSPPYSTTLKSPTFYQNGHPSPISLPSPSITSPNPTLNIAANWNSAKSITPSKKINTSPNLMTVSAVDTSCIEDSYQRLTSASDYKSDASVYSGVMTEIAQACEETAPPMSPRTHYIARCLKEKLNPNVSLIIRKNLTKILNLNHLGIGDKMASILAECLENLPFIHGINICDNRLTDAGLVPILMAVIKIPEVLDLDLSDNIIGPETADLLSQFIRLPTCPLERLTLKKADVDDFECHKFVDAIKTNTTIKELDLSNNKIGSAENLNTVMPDLVTGGESLADLLRTPTCKITTLKLAWNMIRLGGAIDLANSLRKNTILTFLDLSFNSLGREGGIALGVALEYNYTLKNLLLTNNNINSEACFVIAASLMLNRRLNVHVVLDGNPIGEYGSRALMMIPTISGSRVRVQCHGCNIDIRENINRKFSWLRLIKDYRLNMEDGVDRAVAIVLTFLIGGHQSYLFKYIHREVVTVDKLGRTHLTKSRVDLKLVNINYEDLYLDDKQILFLQGWNKVRDASANIGLAIRLFNEIDIDKSGLLDKFDMAKLMNMTGIYVTEKRLTEIMKMYKSKDADGLISLEGFLLFLNLHHEEAMKRIEDLTKVPILALKSSDPSMQTSVPYCPPTKGTLIMSVVDGFMTKAIHKVMTCSDKDSIIEMVKGNGAERSVLIGRGIHNGVKLRIDEGMAIYEAMATGGEIESTKLLSYILPQMIDHHAARQLVGYIIGTDQPAMLRLRREMGSCLRPLIGTPNGYYVLDMSADMDRLCLVRLMQISGKVLQQELNKYSNHVLLKATDRSQKGNFFCFRNEISNGSPVTINVDFASPLPLSGKVQFDFVGCIRPTRHEFGMDDFSFISACSRLMLVNDRTVVSLWKRLMKQEKVGNLLLNCDGRNVYTHSEERARNMAAAMSAFYDNIPLRHYMLETAITKENVIANKSRAAFVLPNGESLYDEIGLDDRVMGSSKSFLNEDPSLDDDDLSVGSAELCEYLYSTRKQQQGLMPTHAEGMAANNNSNSEFSVPALNDSFMNTDEQVSQAIAKAVAAAEPRFKASNRVLSQGLGGQMQDSDDESQESETQINKRKVKSFLAAIETKKVTPPAPTTTSATARVQNRVGNNKSRSSTSARTSAMATVNESTVPTLPASTLTVVAPSVLDNTTNTTIPQEQRDKKSSFASVASSASSANSSSSSKKKQPRHSFSSEGKHRKSGAVETLHKLISQQNEVNVSKGVDVKKDKSLYRIEEQEYLFVSKDVLDKFRIFITSNGTRQSKARRYIDIIADMFGFQWIFARQLANLVALLEIAKVKHTRYFGSYRVEIVVLLFDRVIDMHNFDFVLHELTAEEIGCIYCRLGILNLFNPMKPDGAWELDVSRREERIVVKMLALLAVQEPGPNWASQTFRWTRDMDCMPGWELTNLWLVENSMPRKGIINVTYYSGEGTEKNGCCPNVPIRLSLLKMVLIKETDLVPDSVRIHSDGLVAETPGDKAVAANIQTWLNYLIPNDKVTGSLAQFLNL